jgi:hypothetical protein|tara:strand:- start:411 stop:605 length:195 start_codon:yes stop_codon:yes gene_type:complete
VYRATYKKKDGRKFIIAERRSRITGLRMVRKSERKDGTWTDWYFLPDKFEYEYPDAELIEEEDR